MYPFEEKDVDTCPRRRLSEADNRPENRFRVPVRLLTVGRDGIVVWRGVEDSNPRTVSGRLCSTQVQSASLPTPLDYRIALFMTWRKIVR